MSRHRVTPNEAKARAYEERGPGGRRLCRWCRVEVKPPRRTFCGKPECLHEYRLRTDTGYMRAQVEKRDRGICASCGFDCTWMRAMVRGPDREEAELARAWLLELGAPLARSLWEADHVVPVVEGGGECGLQGMRTLCLWCHKRETAELARRRAAARRSAQLDAQRELLFAELGAGPFLEGDG